MTSSLSPREIGLPDRFSEFRTYPGFSQWETSVAISTSNARISILQAPPGSGKSLIYMAVSRLLGARTLVLTVTKGLQSQLHTDFESCGLVDIRGHSSYPCADISYDDAGDLADLECNMRGDCPYWRDVDRACNSDLVVTNYHHWVQLARSDDPDRLGKFDLLVLDEAHQSPELLCDLLSVKLSKRSIHNLLGLDLLSHTLPISQWIEWCTSACETARERYRARRRVSSSDTDKEANKELQRLTRTGRDLARVAESRKTGIEWIVSKTNNGVVLTPVWCGAYAEQYLFRDTPKVILSSATVAISDARRLNVQDNIDLFEIESGFDPRRRQLIYVPTARVDYQISEGQKRIWVNRIDRIIESGINHKGAIHTRSYARSRDITERSQFSSVLLPHSSHNARETIRKFIAANPPCVLVSPIIEEGIDLPDDLCRWQIIAKVPFVDTREPVMKARCESDKLYANHLAALAIIQMAGRGSRSENDWCYTFIIDDHWAWFRKKAEKEFPKWFRRAWLQSATVPRIEEP